jgi:hypothetical protein
VARRKSGANGSYSSHLYGIIRIISNLDILSIENPNLKISMEQKMRNIFEVVGKHRGLENAEMGDTSIRFVQIALVVQFPFHFHNLVFEHVNH